MITQNGLQNCAIGLFTLDKSAKLKRFDTSSVMSSKPATPVHDFTQNGVAQGYVEGANVIPLMIMLSRTFDNVTSAIEGSETSLKDAIKILGGSA